ncbi:MAG: hypothetical protein AAF215_16120 [Cyanobacteria bacterium P01_A01_bin.123]
MDTLVITEAFITPFKFWHDGQITTGMCFRNELFGQVIVASAQERDGFFQQLDRLNPNASDVVITASKERYIAWVNLKTPLAVHLLAQSEPPVTERSQALALQVV